MVIVQQSAEARPTGDLAICPVVIRRTDVFDELATDALVKPLGHAQRAEPSRAGNTLMNGISPDTDGLGPVVRRERLGDLLNFYYREAA
jgi:hypothetical protein